jgi:hypothetical protein
MNKAEIKAKKYRVPTATAECEISLDEFDKDDIIEYLKRLDSGDYSYVEGYWDCIETLLLCGQRDAAIAEILLIVGKKIGRVI